RDPPSACVESLVGVSCSRCSPSHARTHSPRPPRARSVYSARRARQLSRARLHPKAPDVAAGAPNRTAPSRRRWLTLQSCDDWGYSSAVGLYKVRSSVLLPILVLAALLSLSGGSARGEASLAD